MNEKFVAAMRRATLSTRASNLAEATRVIQGALLGHAISEERDAGTADIVPPPARSQSKTFLLDPDAELVEPSETSLKASGRREIPPTSDRLRKPLGETIGILRQGRFSTDAPASLAGMGLTGLAGPAALSAVPEGARFEARSFTCAAGTRSFRLYIPSSAPRPPLGLIVMLHGCKQNPDDFAAGTGMNAIAEANGLLVAYPGQTGADNASSCWNWFRPGDQARDRGEPSIIAGITREIMSEFRLERGQVYVAGLSAGGAMAAVMGETYPDIYAAVGIHSGLPCGAANDVISAFAAMRGEAGLPPQKPLRTAASASGKVRTIVFHGTADRTVHPSNAKRIVAAASPNRADLTVSEKADCTAGGRTYTRTVIADPAGSTMVEYWMVDGAGHAWSGGQSAGSYTDPKGPDASSEMVRFFLGQQS
ncbi:PHB depolymerase family esterase [Mesorhizobium sp. CAU 1741]|uniref:extracellular catalytic domain type 1 short-chain-length polyhydroxyalkanoate depolymerase n=1 Tax=Mesorhizobium sp. CAU 1741 TaxID=3140366 RepID=UPI00325B9D36